MRKPRGCLNIKLEAKAQLDSVKTPGQSYTGIIQELVKFFKENKDKR